MIEWLFLNNLLLSTFISSHRYLIEEREKRTQDQDSDPEQLLQDMKPSTSQGSQTTKQPNHQRSREPQNGLNHGPKKVSCKKQHNDTIKTATMYKLTTTIEECTPIRKTDRQQRPEGRNNKPDQSMSKKYDKDKQQKAGSSQPKRKQADGYKVDLILYGSTDVNDQEQVLVSCLWLFSLKFSFSS